MAQIYAFTYCIDFWDEVDEKICTESGVVLGETFSEVVCRLEDYYGKDNINSISKLTCFDVGDAYILPERAFEEMGYKLSKKEQN